MFGFGAAPKIEGFEHKVMTVDEMKAAGALIVDIRTPPEWYQTGVIEGAKLVTFQDPLSFLGAIKDEIADGRDIVLVCRSGNRTSASPRAGRQDPEPDRLGGRRHAQGDRRRLQNRAAKLIGADFRG